MNSNVPATLRPSGRASIIFRAGDTIPIHRKKIATIMLLQGLYKVEFETPRRKATGVIFATEGKLRGGSSAYAFVGSYKQDGGRISGAVTSRLHTRDPMHTRDPNVESIFGLDEVRIEFHGSSIGDFAQVEGTAAEAPSLGFKAVLTRLCD